MGKISNFRPISHYVLGDGTRQVYGCCGTLIGSRKGKGSSLDIAPLTILDSGAFTASEVAADWHWL